MLGGIRNEFTHILNENSKIIKKSVYKFVWIVDFPLMSLDDDNNLETMHHPFTHPHLDDMSYLLSHPHKVKKL